MAGERTPLFRQEKSCYVPVIPADLRILLVGKSGSGKSAVGNTILGRGAFESRRSPASVTKKCWIEEGMFEKKTISVTDTPGVYDTDLTNMDLRDELQNCIYKTTPGPHVFLLVISVTGRYNRDEKGAIEWICENFGKQALEYAIVLFTHTDELKGLCLQEFVKQSNDLKNLIANCGGRFCGFNNTVQDRTQVTDLIGLIENMVRSRGYYTSAIFEEAQKQIKRARQMKIAKDTALGVVSTLGTGAAVAGGVVLGATELLLLPGLLIGGGVVAAVTGGVVLSVKKYKESTKKNE